jgi:hypothetical protein
MKYTIDAEHLGGQEHGKDTSPVPQQLGQACLLGDTPQGLQIYSTSGWLRPGLAFGLSIEAGQGNRFPNSWAGRCPDDALAVVWAWGPCSPQVLPAWTQICKEDRSGKHAPYHRDRHGVASQEAEHIRRRKRREIQSVGPEALKSKQSGAIHNMVLAEAVQRSIRGEGGHEPINPQRGPICLLRKIDHNARRVLAFLPAKRPHQV